MDKSKPAPIPEKTGSAQPPQREAKTTERRDDPTFVRGTADPTTKK
jgi:hypothetical protein